MIRSILPIVVALIAGACTSKAVEEEGAAATSTLVETASVLVEDREDVVVAWGTVAPSADASRAVTAGFDGTVVRVFVRPGVVVKAGAPLVEIRPSAQGHLEAEKARIDVQFADAEVARRRALLETKLTTNADVAAAVADLQKAQAELEAFRGSATGGLSTITAPSSALVSAVVVNAGDAVVVGGPVAVLFSGAALRVQLGVEPALVGRLAEGQRVRVMSLAHQAGGDDVVATGVLLQVGRQVDAETHLASALVALDAPTAGATLLPGAVVRAAVIVRTLSAALVVPRRALTQREGHSVVFVVAGAGEALDDAGPTRTAHQRAVTLLLEGDERSAVSGDIKRGDVVVTAGSAEVEDGAVVRTIDLVDDPGAGNHDADDDAAPGSATGAPP